MTRDELFGSIVAARPDRDDLVCIQRCGGAYEWRMLTTTETTPEANAPNVRMSISAVWPFDQAARIRAFSYDPLAELESMADSADRYRWPLDSWPHHH